MVLIFDREDKLLKVLYSGYKWPEVEDPDNPKPAETVAHWASNAALNVQKNNASLVWGVAEVPKVKPSQVRRLFSVSNLTGGR